MRRHLLLHGNGELAVGPSRRLGIPSIVVLGARFLPFGCRFLASLGGSVDHLLSQHCSVLLALLNELLLVGVGGGGISFCWGLLVELALDSCNGGFGIGVVLGVHLLSRLFEHPVVLVIVIMTTFVHEVLENFPHVVIVWSLLELQIPAIIEIGIELLWKSPGQ